MYLVYIDESYDKTHFAYSAIFIHAFRWNSYFQHLLEWRRIWHDDHNIPLDYELHATKFIGGRGEHPVRKDKDYRARLFYDAVGRVESMKGVKVINAMTEKKRKHLDLFERMLNRINRTLESLNAYGVLICDEGNESKLISTVRKMQKYNEIPSNCYHYEIHGSSMRNIPLERIIEDPLFKTSKSSYFIQMADFIAFSLLRNESPADSTRTQVQKAFEQLDTVLVKNAFSKDPRNKGIIRL